MVSKYADHQPLNRMEGILARHGIEISRSTMCDWVRDSAQLLWPIAKALKQSVLESLVLHADATGVLCQENSKSRRTKKAQLWAWVGDKQEVVYDFTLTKEQAEPKRFLENWAGHLQCDAASNFHQVFNSGEVIEVGCWAHARRRYVDALASDTARASRILALVQMLYKVEAQAKSAGLDPPTRQVLRQQESKPILERIREEVEQAMRTVLPKSPLGDALGYVRNQWDALNRFVEDGRLAIDNNAAERVLRNVAVGRKNWLFTGGEDGGKRAATIYSLIGTCRLRGIEPSPSPRCARATADPPCQPHSRAHATRLVGPLGALIVNRRLYRPPLGQVYFAGRLPSSVSRDWRATTGPEGAEATQGARRVVSTIRSKFRPARAVPAS